MEKEELFNRGVCYEIEIIEKRHCTLMHTGKIWIFCTINEGGLAIFGDLGFGTFKVGIWGFSVFSLGFGDGDLPILKLGFGDCFCLKLGFRDCLFLKLGFGDFGVLKLGFGDP